MPASTVKYRTGSRAPGFEAQRDTTPEWHPDLRCPECELGVPCLVSFHGSHRMERVTENSQDFD